MRATRSGAGHRAFHSGRKQAPDCRSDRGVRIAQISGLTAAGAAVEGARGGGAGTGGDGAVEAPGAGVGGGPAWLVLRTASRGRPCLDPCSSASHQWLCSSQKPPESSLNSWSSNNRHHSSRHHKHNHDRARQRGNGPASSFLPSRRINGTTRSAGSRHEGTGCYRSPPLRPRSSRRNPRTKAPSRRARSPCRSSHDCRCGNHCSSRCSKTVQPSSSTRSRSNRHCRRQCRSTTGRRPRRTTCGDSPVR